MISADDLLRQADRLTRLPTRGHAKQADLRRALSTAYYAIFHRLLAMAADELIGATPSRRSAAAWALIYRAYDHGDMARRCAQVANPPSPLTANTFPPAVRQIAVEFRAFQNERHQADYDPGAVFKLKEVRSRVIAAKSVIRLIGSLKDDEARLFAVFLLVGVRRAR